MVKNKKLTLFGTLGYPGSGKTFFACRFTKEFGLCHLSSDRIRFGIFSQPRFTASENAVVFNTMDFLAGQLLAQGISVIYDANLTKRVYRQRLWQIAKRHRANYALLWFKTPVEVALRRVSKRNKTSSGKKEPISEEVLFKIKAEEECPIKEQHIILEPASYKKQKELVKNFVI